MTIADMIGTAFDVNTGYISTFLITPSQIVTSERTKHLSREKRQCQFRHEYNEIRQVWKEGIKELTCLES